jgi:hypothetical protein
VVRMPVSPFDLRVGSGWITSEQCAFVPFPHT